MVMQALPVVAILGAGTAGMNAAIALRAAGYDGVIRMFSDTDIPPYSPILTSYYAGGLKTYEECFPWTTAEIDALKLDWQYNTPVVRLDPEAHTVETPAGSSLYSKCVIATGARAMSFGFPKVEGGEYEPYILRTMENAERLKAMLEDPASKRVLISGASMIALKMLEACLVQGKDCTVVGMNPHLLDMTALPETAVRFEENIKAKGVALRLGQTIAAVKRIARADAGDGRDWQLEVTFSSGDADVFDDICVAHGVRSDLRFIAEGSLEIDRGIVVDEFMHTSNPDVYAAGDVTQALELVSGQKRILGIWKTAALQGAVAGRAIAAELAGQPIPAEAAYKGAIATNTIQVDGTLFISAGSVELTPGRTVEIREADDMTVAYVYEQREGEPRRLVGFNLSCDHDEEGSKAYDIGAMLTMRIERACLGI